MFKIQSKFTWVIAFWFALLQTFSPLMHAHIESEPLQQSQGIHVHGFDTDAHHDQYKHVTVTHTEAHIITVDKGALKEDFQFSPSIMAVMVVLAFSFIIISAYSRSYAVSTPLPLFYRYSTRPRAPPHI
jgi:hypothetical protein